MVIMRNKYNDAIFIHKMIDGTVKMITEKGEYIWNIPVEELIAIYEFYGYKVVI